MINTKTQSFTYIDEKLVASYLDFLGLPKDHHLGFAKQICKNRGCTNRQENHTHIRPTTPEYAFHSGYPLWRRVNIMKHPRRRGEIDDVKGILNIVVEFEYPEQPWLALEVALLFKQMLVEKGYAPTDLPIIISGAGVHLIINIQMIDVNNEEHAQVLNTAIAHVIEKNFTPLFNVAKQMIGLQTGIDLSQMHLEGKDIARLLSAPGDWRPSTKTNDCEKLKGGVLRSVYNEQPLFRHEWEPMRSLILIEVAKLEKQTPKERMQKDDFQFEPDEELSTDAEAKLSVIFHADIYGNLTKAIEHDCEWFYEKRRDEKRKGYPKLPLKSDGSLDRSKWYNDLLFIIASKARSADIAYHFRTILNHACGDKYEEGTRLDKITKNILSEWNGPKRMKQEEREVLQQQTMVRTPSQRTFKQIVEELCIYDKGACIKKDNFITQYCGYCEENNIHCMSESKVSKEIQTLGIIVTQKRVEGKVTKVYVGLRFKSHGTDYPQSHV